MNIRCTKCSQVSRLDAAILVAVNFNFKCQHCQTVLTISAENRAKILEKHANSPDQASLDLPTAPASRQQASAPPTHETRSTAAAPSQPSQNSVTNLTPDPLINTAKIDINFPVKPPPRVVEHSQNPQEAPLPIRFTGNAPEYFRIWIVNIALTLVTLGIFSAWAKVRRKQYFYGNTHLDQAAFEYLGDPIKILKGRIIAIVVLVGLSFVGSFSLLFNNITSIIVAVLMPILFVLGRSFNLRNSSYRGIRFDYQRKYGEAFVVYALLPVLILFSIGLVYPYFIYRHHKFMNEYSQFGTSPVYITFHAGQFYKIYLKAWLWSFLAVLLSSTGIGFFMASIDLSPFAGNDYMSADDLHNFIMGTLVLLFMFPVLFVFAIYTKTHVTNLIWNHLHLEGHRFICTLKFKKMFTLTWSNTWIIVLSLGLLIPWAQIRMMRYRAENLFLVANGNLDDFISNKAEEVSAIGEEMGDLFDLDMGL